MSMKEHCSVSVKTPGAESTVITDGYAYGVMVNSASGVAAVCSMEIGGIDQSFDVVAGPLSQMFVFPKPVRGAVKITLSGSNTEAYVFYGV